MKAPGPKDATVSEPWEPTVWQYSQDSQKLLEDTWQGCKTQRVALRQCLLRLRRERSGWVPVGFQSTLLTSGRMQQVLEHGAGLQVVSLLKMHAHLNLITSFLCRHSLCRQPLFPWASVPAVGIVSTCQCAQQFFSCFLNSSPLETWST